VIRSAVHRVMWVGRSVVFLVGLATILALAYVLVNAALGTVGKPSFSGEISQADPVMRLVGGAGEQALAVDPVATRRQIEYPRGYAQVNVTSATVTLSGARGINGVQRTDNNVYCFDLTFRDPRVAVASANINNNATVGTVLGGGVPSNCPAGFRDAAARTYAANDATSTPRSDINFGIVFI
jgi:hypothetical protein